MGEGEFGSSNFSWKNGSYLLFWEKEEFRGKRNPVTPQAGENPATTQEPIPLPDQVPPPEEPIVLARLFPEAKHDLDTLFPDPQMKQLLKRCIGPGRGTDAF